MCFALGKRLFWPVLASTAFFLSSCALSPTVNPDHSRDAFPTVEQSMKKEENGDLPPAYVTDIPVEFQSNKLKKWVEQQNRLYKVAAPILLKNTRICKKKAQRVLGIVSKTKYSYSDEFIDLAGEQLNLTEVPTITHILPGSGAAKSEIAIGDEILEVDGKKVGVGRNAEKDARRLINESLKSSTSVRLTVQRDSQKFLVDIPSTLSCNINVELGNSDIVNSYADGNQILVTSGMLDYVKSDTELAYVVAKEIAHSLLTNSPRRNMTKMIHTLNSLRLTEPNLTFATQIKPYAAVVDATADKFSLYMLARAGYRIEDAREFWEQLAKRFPENMSNSYTKLHPSTKYRLSVITAVTKVVVHHQKHGLPLHPN